MVRIVTDSLDQVYEQSIDETIDVLNGFEWGVSISPLTAEEEQVIRQRDTLSDGYSLAWNSGINDFREIENGNHIFYLSLKVVNLDDPVSPHAAIIMKYDDRQPALLIYMMENFIRNQNTILDGKVFIIALIFATIFASNIDSNKDRINETDIVLVNPEQNLISYYREFGFFDDYRNHSWMSADVITIQERIRQMLNEDSNGEMEELIIREDNGIQNVVTIGMVDTYGTRNVNHTGSFGEIGFTRWVRGEDEDGEDDDGLWG
ncbi:TPA: hypothetical protein ACTW9U_005004 [Klebsiella quasipneumoniae subsp. similipneumoniae]